LLLVLEPTLRGVAKVTHGSPQREHERHYRLQNHTASAGIICYTRCGSIIEKRNTCTAPSFGGVQHMLSVGNGHHITSTYPRMTLPRDHEKSKRSWKRMFKRAKRPKRLPNFHRQHNFDERDIPTIIEIVDSAVYPSIRDKAARLGCSCSTVRRFVNARRAGKPVINVGKRPQPRRTSHDGSRTTRTTLALSSPALLRIKDSRRRVSPFTAS
jgi:hypothetical protein